MPPNCPSSRLITAAALAVYAVVAWLVLLPVALLQLAITGVGVVVMS